MEGEAPHLVAHYLPWFETKGPVARDSDWAHWRWQGERIVHDPELRLEDGRRDIAAVNYPLIGPYATADRAVLAYHFGTLRAAGVQALVVLWYGPGSDTDAMMPVIFEAAQAVGLRVAPCYEEKINWPGYRAPETRQDIVRSASADISYWLKHYGVSPVHLTRNGQPVLFQFNYWSADLLGPRTLLPFEWREVKAAVGQPFVYVRQNLEAGYHPTLSGAYGWWMPTTAERRSFVERAVAARSAGDLDFFVTMIAPGFDDAGVDGWGNGRRYTSRAGGEMLQETFGDALRGGPELVQLVTWNDFNEGTEFEPTVENGFSALDAMENWWAQSKGLAAPDLRDNREPLRAYLRALTLGQKAEIPPAAWHEAGLNVPFEVSAARPVFNY